MKRFINFALAIFVLPSCQCQVDEFHHYDAQQWDVESPEQNGCATERGFFGRSAKFETKTKYKYELTLVEGPYLEDALRLQAQARSESSRNGLYGVFSAIETRIADAVLQSKVFESVCSGGEAKGPFRRGSGRLLRENTRQLRAVGISSTPEDEILEGLACREFVNETDGPCIVVDGEFVVYLDIYEDLESELNSILSDLMNEEHRLDDAHPYIQKVRYIELTADMNPGSIEAETVVVPSGTSSTLSSSFYALLAAGAFIVVGTGVIYRRRRNAVEHDGDTTTLEQRTAQLQQSQGN